MDHFPPSAFSEEDYEFDMNPELFNSILNGQGSVNLHNQVKFNDDGFFDNFEQGNHHLDNHHENQQYNYNQRNKDLYEDEHATFNYNTTILSQTTESFPLHHNENIEETNKQIDNKNNEPQQTQQRIPIKVKVQMRKEKVQQLKKMKEGIQNQQQQKQIEELNNQNQESQSTDIEKMVEENQERESSNSEANNKKAKKLNKKIRKNKETENSQANASDDEDLPQDKRSQQKIKNRMSAQKSRDQKKQQLAELMNQVSTLSQQVKDLENENKGLQEKLKGNLCSRCSSQCSTDDSSSQFDDYFDNDEKAIIRRNNRYYSGFGMNGSTLIVIIACLCFVGLQVHSGGMNTMAESQITRPMLFFQNDNPSQQTQQTCIQSEQKQLDDLSSRALRLYGINQDNIQDDQVIDTKLIGDFKNPNLRNRDLVNLSVIDQKNDDIICPNSNIILYGKNDHNIVNIILNNQTNYYSGFKDQLYPLYHENQNETIKLTCLILKYEQISNEQQL